MKLKSTEPSGCGGVGTAMKITSDFSTPSAGLTGEIKRPPGAVFPTRSSHPGPGIGDRARLVSHGSVGFAARDIFVKPAGLVQFALGFVDTCQRKLRLRGGGFARTLFEHTPVGGGRFVELGLRLEAGGLAEHGLAAPWM